MIGYRIFERKHTVLAPATLQQFASVGTAQISDCMARIYGVVGLRPFHDMRDGRRMAGQALTVKTRPGDNLMIHKAISIAKAGEILVVDGGGEITNALVGELMAMDAQEQGIGGFVMDGAIRDADYFAAHTFPCFAREACHRGPYKDGPGEINVPVSVGGQVVMPGDVVVGDADGLVAVPLAMAEEILAAALRKEEAEKISKEKILDGSYAKPWMDATIEARRGGR